MSGVDTVDRLYLISKGGVFRFKKSTAEEGFGVKHVL
jgi:hypothetical protein